METKWCPKCKTEKFLSEFYKNKSRKDGLQSQCKQCRTTLNAAWRATTPHRCWAMATLSCHKYCGFKIDITLDELDALATVTTRCQMPGCGCKLDWSRGTKDGKVRPNSPTLDRINNEDVITKDNIQILCYRCNTSKGPRTMIEFVDYCKSVYLHHVTDEERFEELASFAY